MILFLVAQLAVMPDSPHLRYLARSAGLDGRVVESVAWHESRNELRPRLRGEAGEWGRFQILPRTARRRCPALDVRTYKGNTQCFIKMFSEDTARHGTVFALHQQNHSTAYAERVLADALEEKT